MKFRFTDFTKQQLRAYITSQTHKVYIARFQKDKNTYNMQLETNENAIRKSVKTYPSTDGCDPCNDMLLYVFDNAGQDLATHIFCSFNSGIHKVVNVPENLCCVSFCLPCNKAMHCLLPGSQDADQPAAEDQTRNSVFFA